MIFSDIVLIPFNPLLHQQEIHMPGLMAEQKKTAAVSLRAQAVEDIKQVLSTILT